MNLRLSENYRTRITDGTTEGTLVGWEGFLDARKFYLNFSNVRFWPQGGVHILIVSVNSGLQPVVLIQSEGDPRSGSPGCELYFKRPVTNATNVLCTFTVLMSQIKNFKTFHHLYALKKVYILCTKK